MALNGTQLLWRDIIGLAHDAGWRDEAVIKATAIACAESSRYTEAVNTQNPDGSIDYGLWQINSSHFGKTIGGHLVDTAACFDPPTCAAIAHGLWQEEGWTPWVAYATGAYKIEVSRTLDGLRNYWRLRYGLSVTG